MLCGTDGAPRGRVGPAHTAQAVRYAAGQPGRLAHCPWVTADRGQDVAQGKEPESMALPPVFRNVQA